MLIKGNKINRIADAIPWTKPTVCFGLHYTKLVNLKYNKVPGEQ